MKQGAIVAALIGLFLGVWHLRERSGSLLEKRPSRRPTGLTDTPPVEKEDTKQESSSSSSRTTPIAEPAKLRRLIETSEDPRELVASLAVLGNAHRIGAGEVRSLLSLLSRSQDETVLCQALWALGLSEEAYPYDRVLEMFHISRRPRVRAAAVASLGSQVDPGMKRALFEQWKTDPDPIVRQEIRRSLQPGRRIR